MFYLGCEQSEKSLEIFGQAEAENAKLVKNLRKFVLTGQIGTYLPSLFVPISYLLLNFPKPEQWLLPFATEFPYVFPLRNLSLD